MKRMIVSFQARVLPNRQGYSENRIMPDDQLSLLLTLTFVLGLVAGLLLSLTVRQAFSWVMNRIYQYRYVRIRRVNRS